MKVNNLKAAERYTPRELTADETKEILALKRVDVTSELLKSYFAARLTPSQTAAFYLLKPEDPDFDKKHDEIVNNSKARFLPNDTMYIPAGTFNVKERTKTTIGRYLYNLLAIPNTPPLDYIGKYGYINVPVTKKVLSDVIEKNMGTMILSTPRENQAEALKQFAEYTRNSEWYAMNTAYYLAPAEDIGLILPNPEVMALKDELFTKYKKEFAENNTEVVNKVEAELVKKAKELAEKENDPFYDYYASKAFDFDLIQKKTAIMGGVIKDAIDPRKTHIIKSNYIEGTDPDEYDILAQLSVEGGTARGVYTQIYGYETKKYNYGLQNDTIDNDNDSDCGTTKTLDVLIDKDLISLWYYRFIVLPGGKLLELTPDNIGQYAGKVVHMRSPMYCLGVDGDKICTHCAGTLFKRINIDNAGLTVSNITGNLLNMSMKTFHDSTVHTSKINVDDYIVEH
jgi:hypothetical protein